MNKLILSILSITLLSLHVSAQVTDGLIAAYEFDGDAIDAFGSINGSMVGDVTPATDRFGNENSALSLNTLGSYINLSDTNAFEFTDKFTISIWIKRTGTLGNYGVIFNREGEYEFGDQSDREIWYAVKNTDPDWTSIRINKFFTNSSWEHSVFSYNDGVISIYSDGQLIYRYNGSGLIGDHPNTLDLDELWIGARASDANAQFKGSIDQLRIYNRALAYDEIKMLYKEDSDDIDFSNGLLAYFPFDGDAEDAIGNADGEIIGANTTIDRHGNPNGALRFDGADDYVNLGDNELFKFTDNFSFSFWSNRAGPNATPNGSSTIINREGEYEFGDQGSGEIWWAIDNTSPDWIAIMTGKYMMDHKWHHFVFQYDGAKVSVFKDAVLIYSYNATGTINDAHPEFNQLWIGGREASDNFFNGAIDDLRIYNRNLSRPEVRELYIYEAADNGIVGKYPFNGDASDVTGKVDGQVFGAALTEDRFGEPSSAYEFSELTDYISLGDTLLHKFEESFSISLWCNRAGLSPSSNSRGIIFNREGEYELGDNEHGIIWWAVANESPGWMSMHTTIPYVQDNWHHIVTTYEMGRFYIYLDNELIYHYEGRGIIGDTEPSLNEFQIGNRQWSESNFNGKIDDLVIFSYAICPKEVDALFNLDGDLITGYAYHVYRNEEITAYPNPAFNQLNISTYSNGMATLYNQNGDLVITKKLIKGQNTLDVKAINSGLYLLRISDEKGEIIQKEKIIIE